MIRKYQNNTKKVFNASSTISATTAYVPVPPVPSVPPVPPVPPSHHIYLFSLVRVLSESGCLTLNCNVNKQPTVNVINDVHSYKHDNGD